VLIILIILIKVIKVIFNKFYYYLNWLHIAQQCKPKSGAVPVSIETFADKHKLRNKQGRLFT